MAAEEAMWVERLGAGETDEPVRALYGRYGRRLYGLGLQLLGDSGMAEELVQETFVRLWRSSGRFDRSRASVRTFVFMLARRVAVDMRRRSGSRLETRLDGAEELEQAANATPFDGDFEQLLLGLEVREALGSLSDKHRETLELYYDRDLSQREIAEQLQVPLGTVKTRTYHALRALGAELEERGSLG